MSRLAVMLFYVLTALLAALRASLGHPDPYPLQWVEIGNEDFSQASTYAAYRWPEFAGNLSKTFPNLRECNKLLIIFVDYLNTLGRIPCNI